jgi:hypothetical protein
MGAVCKTAPTQKKKGVKTMTKEQTIQNYMDKLQISRQEAELLYEDDANDFISDEGEEMTRKAKKLNAYTPTEKGKKKRTPKKDHEKIMIIMALNDCLDKMGFYPDIVNPQRQIDFGDYSLTLIKHRPPKK